MITSQVSCTTSLTISNWLIYYGCCCCGTTFLSHSSYRQCCKVPAGDRERDNFEAVLNSLGLGIGHSPFYWPELLVLWTPFLAILRSGVIWVAKSGERLYEIRLNATINKDYQSDLNAWKSTFRFFSSCTIVSTIIKSRPSICQEVNGLSEQRSIISS